MKKQCWRNERSAVRVGNTCNDLSAMMFRISSTLDGCVVEMYIGMFRIVPWKMQRAAQQASYSDSSTGWSKSIK